MADMTKKEENRGQQSMDKARDAGQQAVDKTKEAASSVGRMASNAASSVGHLASAAVSSVGHAAGQAASSVGHAAGQAASSVGHMATDAASAAGHTADNWAGSAGSGLKKLGDTISSQAPREGMLGTAAQSVAQTIREGGKYIEDAKLSGMAEDFTQLVRRNPLPAILVGVAVGFLIGRSMRS